MISRFRQVGTAHRRHPHWGRSVAAGLTATLLILAGCTGDKPKPTPPPSRILQSVAVQMTPDGTTTAIDGTALSVHDDAGDATSEKTTYSPRDVAKDLPVRVTTTYRTADRTGTNLADLAGHNGRIEIDLTVQNLTVHPQKLTYDAAGSSRTQSALVGAPLTVVASTALPKTKPTDVITASAAAESTATNGVLSQTEDGGSVVQWAALLAAPQMGTNATLRLVTNAKDFQVPNFDLSVQPGLVTDPSVSGVLDSAFNSNPASQLALEQRTIKVITDVNGVLTRASDNISGVRKNLDSTSKELGKKTVEELQTSTKGVADSMKSLDKELKSLSSDISSTLDGTQSAIVSELGKTVSTVDELLGDTSAEPPAATLDGKGCKTTVKQPGDASSVYGNLMQVTAQLNGYATATGACKKEAQAALSRSVGPAEPSAETCTSPSTTCALYNTEQKFSGIMSEFKADGEKLIKSLQPFINGSADDDFADLSKSVDAVDTASQRMTSFNPYEDFESRLTKVTDKLDDVDDQVDDLADQLTSIHDEATKAAADIDGRTDTDSTYRPSSMLAQNAKLADELCGLQEGSLIDGKVSSLTVNRLRSYLVGKSCPDEEGNTTDLPKPAGYAGPMDDRLTTQADTWKKIADDSDVEDTTNGAGQQLASVRSQINLARSRVKSVRAALVTGETGLKDRLPKLTEAVKDLKDDRDTLGKDLDVLQGQQQSLEPTIRTAFDDAADKATGQVKDAIKPQIRKIAAQAAVDSKAVSEMFDASAAGLSNAATQISKNGTKTIDDQKKQLASSQKRTTSAASKYVDQSLKQLATGVSSSTRDMNAASEQLTQSLRKVLLDLGTRKVKGSGLLGAMTTSAAKVGTADYQLALAADTTSAYAGVRSEDVNGILLRQAQLQASLKAGADLPAFHLSVPTGAESQTVYTFRVGEAQ